MKTLLPLVGMVLVSVALQSHNAATEPEPEGDGPDGLMIGTVEAIGGDMAHSPVQLGTQVAICTRNPLARIVHVDDGKRSDGRTYQRYLVPFGALLATVLPESTPPTS